MCSMLRLCGYLVPNVPCIFPILHPLVIILVLVDFHLDFLSNRLSLQCESPSFSGHPGWDGPFTYTASIFLLPVVLGSLVGFDIGKCPFVECDPFLVVLVALDMS